jgi:hypothetical protein
MTEAYPERSENPPGAWAGRVEIGGRMEAQ